MRLLPVDAEPALPAAIQMIEYIFGVLDALGIRNGAIHSEIKIEERGPGASHACVVSPASAFWPD